MLKVSDRGTPQLRVSFPFFCSAEAGRCLSFQIKPTYVRMMDGSWEEKFVCLLFARRGAPELC